MQNTFNIVSIFKKSVNNYDSKVAIIHNNNSISYRQLSEKISITKHYLLYKGIRPKDRVLILCPISIELYTVLLAIFEIGAVAVFLDQWSSISRIKYSCQHANCKAIIGNTKMVLLSYLFKETRKINLKIMTSQIKQVNDDAIKALPQYQSQEDDAALITYSTGTTGMPKAAIRSHKQLLAQLTELEKLINKDPNEVDMPFLPIILLINLALGKTSVIPKYNHKNPHKTSIRKILYDANLHRVTSITSSPYILLKMGEHILHNQITIRSLRSLTSGGAPIYPIDQKYITNSFRLPLTIVYGSTEAEPISHFTLHGESIKAEQENGLYVGTPIPNINLLIMPLNFIYHDKTTSYDIEAAACRPGDIGEIVVSGHHVLTHYYNNSFAEKENKVWINNTCWHRTGDSGFVNLKNQLFLTGRIGQLIQTSQGIISPFVYESKLRNISQIALGTIVQKEDKIICVIELNLTNKLSQCMDSIFNIAPFIDGIELVKSMPRDKRHFSRIDYDGLVKGK
jgi:olefin beta-lactone synthetase